MLILTKPREKDKKKEWDGKRNRVERKGKKNGRDGGWSNSKPGSKSLKEGGKKALKIKKKKLPVLEQ
jgi:hypothetical protein